MRLVILVIAQILTFLLFYLGTLFLLNYINDNWPYEEDDPLVQYDQDMNSLASCSSFLRQDHLKHILQKTACANTIDRVLENMDMNT